MATRGDGRPTGSDRGRARPRDPEQGRGRLRAVGPVRAAAAHGRLGGLSRGNPSSTLNDLRKTALGGTGGGHGSPAPLPAQRGGWRIGRAVRALALPRCARQRRRGAQAGKSTQPPRGRTPMARGRRWHGRIRIRNVTAGHRPNHTPARRIEAAVAAAAAGSKRGAARRVVRRRLLSDPSLLWCGRRGWAGRRNRRVRPRGRRACAAASCQPAGRTRDPFAVALSSMIRSLLRSLLRRGRNYRSSALGMR